MEISLRLFPFLYLPLFLLFSNSFSVTARNSLPTITTTSEGETSQLQTYIVYVQPQEATVFASSVDQETWYKSFLPTTTIASSSAERRMVYMYTKVVTGFAARLTEQEVNDMSKKEGFVHAYRDRLYSLKTTHTPNFLGLNLQSGLWNESNMGKGVIIGVLDTGVFPNHPSFSDNGIPPPPSKWKGRCEFNTSVCNNKLIGARAFFEGARAMKGGSTNGSVSPLDESGHGTHTSSTAAGAFVAGAQVLGNAEGTASGMAPYAHLAIYKACDFDGIEGCFTTDMLAGLDAAVSDGVDVMSVSIGGDSVPFYDDGFAVAAFRAMEKGVFVSCAAGNDGPVASTLSNEAPWLLTVAASTTDRSIRATVRLGNGFQFDGESIFQPQIYPPSFFPLLYAGASGKPGSSFCGNGSLDGLNVKGKVVLCERGGNIARIDKGGFVKSAGGVAMILMNSAADGYSTLADPHVLPASHVGFSDGTKIKEYINCTTNPTATILFKGTVLGTSPAPAMASFSSRGPSLASPGILKPDITGPGVSILAAWPFAVGPPSANNSSTGATFNMISGTSMSTPHLSGIAALIKSVHPEWSPAAVKSAIMTTANLLDQSGKPIVDEQHLPADLFAIGAGHVNPTKANDPGLVYDLSADDYIPYLCGLGYTSAQVKIITGHPIDCSTVTNITEGDLNYPSISVLFGAGDIYSVTLERKVKNVGEASSTYWVEVDAPAGVSVDVEPKILQFCEVNEEKKFKVTLSRSTSTGSGSTATVSQQGYLKWVSKERMVRSPISVTFKK